MDEQVRPEVERGLIVQDLLNGKRTLPIVHALSTLRGVERERLRKLLAVARESEEHHD